MKVRRNLFITSACIVALSALSSCGTADEPTSDSNSAVVAAKDESSVSVSDISNDDSSYSVSESRSETDDIQLSADSSESSTPITFDDLPYGPAGLDKPPTLRPSANEERKEFTDDGIPIVYFRMDGDQAVISEDGAIRQSFEYELNEEKNCIDVTFVTVNNSDEACTLQGGYPHWAITDKTDLSTAFASDTVHRTIYLNPKQTVTKTFSHLLPDDWSILKLDVILAPDTDYKIENASDHNDDSSNNEKYVFNENTKTVYLGSASFAVEITP